MNTFPMMHFARFSQVMGRTHERRKHSSYKMLSAQLQGFQTSPGCFRDWSVPTESPEGRNPTGFSVLPGKQTFPRRKVRIPGESVVYLVGPKARMDCGPRGLGPDTPRGEKPSKQFLVTAQQTYLYVHRKLPYVAFFCCILNDEVQ